MEPENYYLPMRQCLAAAVFHSCDIFDSFDASLLAQLKLVTNLDIDIRYPSSRETCVNISEKIFIDDLSMHPNTVWALKGLKAIKSYKDYEIDTYSQSGLSEVNVNSTYLRRPLSSFQLNIKYQYLNTGSCCELGYC
jgi:hypothetical protein